MEDVMNAIAGIISLSLSLSSSLSSSSSLDCKYLTAYELIKGTSVYEDAYSNDNNASDRGIKHAINIAVARYHHNHHHNHHHHYYYYYYYYYYHHFHLH